MVKKVSLVDNIVKEIASLICRGIYKRGTEDKKRGVSVTNLI